MMLLQWQMRWPHIHAGSKPVSGNHILLLAKVHNMEIAWTGSQQQAASLVFLYQLRSGACPCSYGLQVAQLAGIPKGISESARRAGAVLESRLQAGILHLLLTKADIFLRRHGNVLIAI